MKFLFQFFKRRDFCRGNIGRNGKSQQNSRNRIKIEIEGLDRMGMINDITAVISNNMNMDMKSMSIESNNGVFLGNINLEVKNKSQLEETFKQLKNINGVSRVKRL